MPLQISLFPSFIILVRIAPLVFLTGYSEFMILEMSSLFPKLKTNNCVVSRDDLILIMLGWFSYFRIAFTSGSSGNLLEIRHFLIFSPLVVKVITEVSCYMHINNWNKHISVYKEMTVCLPSRVSSPRFSYNKPLNSLCDVKKHRWSDGTIFTLLFCTILS